MKEKKYTYFHFLPFDGRGAGAWLNGMAAEGWAFQGLRWPLGAEFCRVRGEPPRYEVDIGDRGVDGTEREPGYLELCGQTGWELCARTLSLSIFRAAPGARPAPLQTDEALEGDRLRRLVLWPGLRSALATLLLPALYLLLLPGIWTAAASNPVFTAALFGCGLCAAWAAVKLGLTAYCLCTGRLPLVRGARVRGIIDGALGILPVALLAGVLLAGR